MPRKKGEEHNTPVERLRKHQTRDVCRGQKSSIRNHSVPPSLKQEEARKMEEKLQCKKTLQIQYGILESNHPHRKAMLS